MQQLRPHHEAVNLMALLFALGVVASAVVLLAQVIRVIASWEARVQCSRWSSYYAWLFDHDHQ